MTIAEIAHVALTEALATRAHPIEMTVHPHRLDLVVQDHRVVVEVWNGVVRVHFVHPSPGDGPATRDQRVRLDDADAEIVGWMVRKAITAALTPF
jgi:hypothetical protein